MDLRRQLAILWAWFPVLLASVLLAGCAAFVFARVQAKVYEAQATLIVGQSLSAANPDYTQLLASEQLAATYARVATTRPILDSVITQLKLGITPAKLVAAVRADAPVGGTLVTISAKDTDPTRAAAIANALADQLIAASPAIQGRQGGLQESIDGALAAIRSQIQTTQEQIEALTALSDRTAQQDADLQTLGGQLVTLNSSYATLLASSSSSASNLLSVIEPAVPPAAPVSPVPLLDALVGALVGLLIAAGVAFVSEYLDDTVKTPEDVQETVGLPTLGTVARIRGDRSSRVIDRLVALLHPWSSAAEEYRVLRTNIEFASVDAPIRSLLVTSSVPGEGKTVTVANLAVVFAQAGRRVLLVDGDLRKPGVHSMFNLPNSQGLTTLIRSDEVASDAVVQETEEPNLRVLATGPLPPNPAELLGSERMRTVLARLQTGHDLLLLDSPPVRAVTDAAILSSLVDGTILVVDAARSRRNDVREAREALAKVGATVLGAVLNRIPAPARSAYDQYYAAENRHQMRAAEGGELPAVDAGTSPSSAGAVTQGVRAAVVVGTLDRSEGSREPG